MLVHQTGQSKIVFFSVVLFIYLFIFYSGLKTQFGTVQKASVAAGVAFAGFVKSVKGFAQLFNALKSENNYFKERPCLEKLERLEGRSQKSATNIKMF